MADPIEQPLVQTQKPLTQASDQQPVFQRGVDPIKLQGFLIQEHYENKIRTILGDDRDDEAVEIFNLEGMNWKEKYAEAKTRTSPIIDELDRMEMNIDADGNQKNWTSDDIIKYYMENPNLDYKEASHLRTVLSSKQAQETAVESAKISSRTDLTTEEKEIYKKKATNFGHRAKADDKLSYIAESVRHEINADLEKKVEEFDPLTTDYKPGMGKNPEMEAELDKLEALFTKDLDSWNTGEKSNLDDIQQTLHKLSKIIQFGNTYTTAAGVTYSRTSLSGIPDKNYINIVRKKWVEKQMNKVTSAREDINKIRVFRPEESPVMQTQQQQQVQAGIETQLSFTGTDSAGIAISNKHDDIILDISNKEGVDPNLIKAIRHKENEAADNSLVNPTVGATGLMQVTQVALDDLAKDGHNYTMEQMKNDPKLNVEAGVKFFKKSQSYADSLISKYPDILNTEDRLEVTLSVYNAGYGTVDKSLKELKSLPQGTENAEYRKKILDNYNPTKTAPDKPKFNWAKPVTP